MDIASGIIALLTFLSPFFLKKKYSRDTIAGLTVTFGILGTFIGVFLGLYNFDTSNIVGSVPDLLNGLKLAFVTSIAGMLTSILVKLNYFYQFPVTDESNDSKHPIEIMISLLNKIEKKMPIQNDLIERDKKLINSIEKIEKSIAGDGDSTLLTQIQKLRTNFQDSFSKLNKSFRDFADKMVADSTQSLVDALTEVMKDFNAKINEQFGENFQQLNEAVGRMLEWQQQYERQISVEVEYLEKISKSLTNSDEIFSNIVEKASLYSDTAERLSELLQHLGLDLNIIKQLADDTENIFPIIKNNIEELTSSFSEAVQDSVKENHKIMEAQRNGIENQISYISKTQEEVNSAFSKSVAEVNKGLEKITNENAKRITEQIAMLDTQLNNELNKAISSLGSQLLSLSNKFVSDYLPLTEKLQNILDIAQQIRK